MKIYWYETNADEGVAIVNGDRWIYKYGGNIDGLTVSRENAAQIAANIRDGIKNGGFEFDDWYNDANYRSNPPKYKCSGTGAKKFINEAEKCTEI